MDNIKGVFSYFDPTSNQYEDVWDTFNYSLNFNQQIATVAITALAFLGSLPILGLGGLAAFRKTVQYFSPQDIKDLPATAVSTDRAAQKLLNPSPKELQIEKNKLTDQFFSKIPEDEAEEFSKIIRLNPLSHVKEVVRIRYLEVIRANIKQGKRFEVVGKYKDLLEGVKSVHELPEVLINLQKLSEAEIEDVKSLVFQLRDDKNIGTTLALILRCVIDLPKTQTRSLLLNGISKCLKGIGKDNYSSVLQILRNIAGIGAEVRVDVVEIAIMHIRSTMEPLERRFILSALLDVKGELSNVDDRQLQEMIQVKKRLVEFFKDIKNCEDKRGILFEINKIPEGNREEYFSYLVPMLSKIQNATQFKEIIDGLKIIAPQYRSRAVAGFINGFGPEFSWKKVAARAFKQAEILEESRIYLRDLLERETDEQEAHDIAQKIYGNLSLFGIDAEGNDPLFAIVMAAVPMENDQEKSPYAIYRLLLKIDKEVITPRIHIKQQLVCDEQVKMNQSHFEKMVRDCRQVTFRDLNPPITLQTLQGLFSAFDERLKALTEAERERIFSKGVSGCLVTPETGDSDDPSPDSVIRSYSRLRDLFLGSAYVRNTLKLKGTKGRIVPSGYLHIYATIKYIMETSKEIDPSTGLTFQEEMLIRMISSIQHCGTGKSEGFAEFYSCLPATALFKGGTGVTKKSDKAKAYLADVVQSVLGAYLTTFGPMAKEVGGNISDGQFVHTRKFLKNLIAKRVGLKWDIDFDLHPGCINNHLYKKAIEENGLKNILEIFYKHITPKVFLQDVFKRVEKDLVPNQEVILAIDKDLQKVQLSLNSKMQEGQIPKFVRELSEEKQKIMMTKVNLMRAKKRSQEVLDQAQADSDSLNVEIQRVEKKLIDEKRFHGVDVLEDQMKALDQKMKRAQEKVNQNLFGQFNALLQDCGSLEGAFTPIDSSEELYTVQSKGVLKALIKAGYLMRCA